MTSGSDGLPEDSFEDVITVNEEVKVEKKEEERYVLDSVVVPARRSKLSTEKTTSIDNLTLSNTTDEAVKEEGETSEVSCSPSHGCIATTLLQPHHPIACGTT